MEHELDDKIEIFIKIMEKVQNLKIYNIQKNLIILKFK